MCYIVLSWAITKQGIRNIKTTVMAHNAIISTAVVNSSSKRSSSYRTNPDYFTHSPVPRSDPFLSSSSHPNYGAIGHSQGQPEPPSTEVHDAIHEHEHEGSAGGVDEEDHHQSSSRHKRFHVKDLDNLLHFWTSTVSRKARKARKRKLRERKQALEKAKEKGPIAVLESCFDVVGVEGDEEELDLSDEDWVVRRCQRTLDHGFPMRDEEFEV